MVEFSSKYIRSKVEAFGYGKYFTTSRSPVFD